MELSVFLNSKWEDSKITRLYFYNNYLKISLTDWKELTHDIEFTNVYALKIQDFLEEDISHISYEKSDEGLSISFISAWDEGEIVTFRMENSLDV